MIIKIRNVVNIIVLVLYIKFGEKNKRFCKLSGRGCYIVFYRVERRFL